MYKFNQQVSNKQLPKGAVVAKIINYLQKEKVTDDKFSVVAEGIGVSRRTFFNYLPILKGEGLVEVRKAEEWRGLQIVWKGGAR